MHMVYFDKQIYVSISYMIWIYLQERKWFCTGYCNITLDTEEIAVYVYNNFDTINMNNINW